MQTKIKYLLVSFIFLLTSMSFVQSPSNKFVVVLDAGHGGKDPGNLGNGLKEKNIALNIVLNIGKELEKLDGIKVIYTRKSDKFIDLHERGAIANRADADLFVSVHCDAWTESQVNGASTFVLGTKRSETNFDVAKRENEVIFLEENHEKNYEGFDPNNPESLIGLMLMTEDYLDQSIQLASYVQNNFTNQLRRKNRGVKQEGFIVLHQTYMPSVLIETGFLTNKKEGRYLSSNKGQMDMAMAIKEAIIKYKTSLNDSFDSSVLDEPTRDGVDTSSVYPEIAFKVQIAAGSRKLETKPYNFNGLNNITMDPIGNGYRYFYGETSNYKEILKLKEVALKKGYSSSFIVAYKNGERIKMEDALKRHSN